MKILLDTCAFLWIITDAPRLSDRAHGLFRDQVNDVFLSPVSAWEITVKHTLGRLPLPEAPERFVPDQRKIHAIHALPLEEEAVLHLGRLPQLHKDPFDRMLICQAMIHELTILTPDDLILQYPVRTIW
ncbi:MAG: type II toxin-antitoxin system VapC family toxin [Deltaproteobacteria bacterium]|nr:type II toxin-antitoxin system VapC family toxin [Deltaproteobacteria bacterium]